MNFPLRGLTCLLLASSLLTPLHAEDAGSGHLVITQPWSRATPNGARVAGGYLTIENRGSVPDRLLSASTELARKLEIHDMALKDGVMTMRPVEGGVAVEPGQAVKFAPGGYHLMFVELNAPFRQGEQVPVTLTFEHAGEIRALFDVQGVGAPAPVAAETCAAARVATAAPAAAAADDNFFTHLHTERAMANVTVSPARAGAVEIAIQLENTDELPLSAEAVSVTLENPEQGVAAVTADAIRIGNDQWRVRMSAPVAGRWSLGLGIAITATDKVNIVSPILIR